MHLANMILHILLQIGVMLPGGFPEAAPLTLSYNPLPRYNLDNQLRELQNRSPNMI